MAPREQLTSDLVAAQAEWRTRLGLSTTRDRSDNYPNYLEVWDRCEGFSEGRYRRGNVQSFAALASELRQSPSTIRNRYYRAFQLISGHDYSLANWFALMGAQQLSSAFGNEVSAVSHRRLRRSASEAAIDFSAVTRSGSSVESRASSCDRTAQDRQDTEHLMRRICQLIENNATDQEIVDQIDLDGTQEFMEGLAYLRTRDDLRSAAIGDAEI